MAEPDPILVNDWHAVVELDFLATRGSFATELLGVPIEITETGPGEIRVVRRDTNVPPSPPASSTGTSSRRSASPPGTSCTSRSVTRRIGST